MEFREDLTEVVMKEVRESVTCGQLEEEDAVR